MFKNHKLSLKGYFISPTEQRLRAGWRLLMHLLIFIAILILLGLPIALLQNSLSANNFLLMGYLGMTLAMTLSILTARKFLDKRKLVSLGLRWDSSSSRDILVGVGIAGVMMSTIFAAEWLFHLIKVEKISWESPDGSSVVGGLLLWFVMFVIVAWNEELYSRGYLLQNLAEGFNLPIGIIISSVLFSLAHLLNPSPSIMSVFGIIAAGLFFAFSYVRTQRLWLAMGLHLGWNFFEGPIYGFSVSGLETVKLIQHTPSGPEIITGGAFGPEAGGILYPALAIGTAMIYLYTRCNILVSED